MKRKIFGVLLALMLVLGFTLVAAPAVSAEPLSPPIVSAEGISNTAVEVTFAEPITAEQAGPIQYSVTFSLVPKGTASTTVAEGDETAVLSLDPSPMEPQGVYRLSPGYVPFFVGEGQYINDGFTWYYSATDHVHTIYRTYDLYIPSTYDGSEAVPLIFSFHGRSLNGAYMVNRTGFTDVAENENFIAVFPDSTNVMPPKDADGNYLWGDLLEGKPPSWTAESLAIQWSMGFDTTYQDRYGIDDVYFVEELLNRLETDYNIDETRIYATGWSSGGMLVSQLAVRMADRFAGIISASGGTLPFDNLVYIPINYIQTVGAIEDESIRPAPALTSAESAEFWADVDDCGPGVVSVNDDYYTQTTYSGGIWGTEVMLLVVHYQGHAWPNQPGGLDPQAIWNLLKEYALTPEAMTAGAISSTICSLEGTVPPGTINSLRASLNTAMQALGGNPANDVAALNALEALINKIEAQSGKKIPEEVADELIDMVESLITLLS